MNKADGLVDIQSALLYGSEQLNSRSDNPVAESRILLGFVIDKPLSWLIAWPETVIKAEQNTLFQHLIKRRRNREPIAYITGKRDFWSLTLKVSPDTLIPRADTEVLVETALTLISKHQHTSLLDLGTGSGAIALAIASECPALNVLATDFSDAALQIAKQNLRTSGYANVDFLQSNWFSSLPQHRFDIIVSNPPYIEENDKHLSDIELKYEPITALTSGKDGLNDIRHIIGSARDWLSKHGHLALEHGYNQAEAVRALFLESGYSNIQSLTDYAGHERVTFAQH